MAKHIAIYARVSTRAQDTKSQEPDLQRWAAAQPEPVEWYKDTASGKTMDRPAWNKLVDAMRAGRVSQIVVWRLDRLGRTAKGLTALFVDLRQYRVNLVSMREGIDLATPAGRMMANMLASVAEYETELRGERVAAGQAAARARGKRWGGSLPGKRKKVTADQEQIIRQLHSQDMPITRIAKVVKLSRPTVYDVLNAKVAC